MTETNLISPNQIVRWDAAARTLGNGNERSLNGGLRFSVEGGSYGTFKNEFNWATVPSDAAFQAAIEGAFNAWTVTDPASGLGTTLSFVADFGTTPTLADNTTGAEIDIFRPA